MVGWKWHPERDSGEVQRRVKQVIAELRLREFTTNELMSYVYPDVKPHQPAFFRLSGGL
jgi:hypothetical protein